MAPQRTGKHPRACDAKINTTILDRGNRRPRNARQAGEFALTEFLQVTQDPYGLSRAHLDALARGTERFHSFPFRPVNTIADSDRMKFPTIT